ncbi:MAG: NusG domain II-containing protein, partial [Ruthenibacterium sp.]
MKKNILFAVCIVLAAALLGVLLYPGRKQGAVARVSIADGDSFSLALSADGIYRYATDTGARLPFALEIADGRIRFLDSKCPDHVCEGFGWLSREHEEAICI